MSKRTSALPFLMLCLLWPFSSLAQSSTVNVPLTQLDCFASGNTVPVEFLYAEAGIPVELIAQRSSDQWQLLQEGAVRPVGVETSAWLRFAVSSREGAQDQQWWVTIGWPSMEHLQMHVLSPDGELRWSSRPVGEDYPLRDRYKIHRHFLFPLKLDAGETAVVYLEVRSNKLNVVPLEIWEANDFVESDQVHLVILGAVFGSLLVMFFYNLSLYSTLLDRVYLYYSAYVAAVFVYLLVVSGLGVYYLWDGSPWLKSRGAFFASLSFLAAALFIRYFLALPYYRGWVLAVNNFFVLLWAGTAALSLVLPLTPGFLGLINLASLLSSAASTVTGCYLWWFRRSSSAKIFIFAWTFLNIGTVVHVLSLQGALPLNFFTRYAQMGGIVVELAIVSFALAYRINEAKLAQARADQEALSLTQQMSEERAQRLRAQIATLEAQKRLNEELEIRVQQRTEQLNETMVKLEQANNELRLLSTTDPLTNVYNRRYLDEALMLECKRAKRASQHLALIMLDIDHFKPVNDHYGHAVGDRCLRAVAEALKDVVQRPGDLLARYGGEEFVLVLPDTDEVQALQVAEKTRAAVAALKLNHEGEPLPLTISAGVAAAVPSGEETSEFLLMAADRALYRAKDDGRNRVVPASQLVPDLL